jgi:hypothetical protein
MITYGGAGSRRSPTNLTLATPRFVSHPQEVTASLQSGDLILTLTFFPADKEKTNQQQVKLNFIADQNSEGAALCIDGFMNMHHEASWTAFLYVMAKDGTTRVGPYCQWSLNYGEFDIDISRAQKVEQLLKIMANH